MYVLIDFDSDVKLIADLVMDTLGEVIPVSLTFPEMGCVVKFSSCGGVVNGYVYESGRYSGKFVFENRLNRQGGGNRMNGNGSKMVYKKRYQSGKYEHTTPE